MSQTELFNLNYYNHAAFTGSKQHLCYKLSKVGYDPEDQADADLVQGTAAGSAVFYLEWWRGPLNSEMTNETKEGKYFPYTDEGLTAVAAFIDSWETEPAHGDLFKGGF